MPVAVPVSALTRREVDADRPADRRAGRGVRRGQVRRRRLAAFLPRDVALPQRVEQEPEQLGPVGGRTLDRQRGRLGDRELVRGHPDVQTDPDDRSRAAGGLDPLDQDPGHLALCPIMTTQQDVVRPLHRRVEPGRPQRLAHLVTGQQRDPWPGRRRCRRAEQDGEGQRGPGRRLPASGRAARARRSGARPRSRGLPVRRPGHARRPARWSSRPPPPPPPGGRAAARRRGWASGGVRGHEH